MVILDTAGRSQLDSALMDELTAITKKVHPVETLLVVDSMIGQEAVNIAKGFREAIPLTGLMLTKMDGDCPRRRGHLHPLGDRGADQVHRHRRGAGCAGDLRPRAAGLAHPGDGRHPGADRESRSSLRRADGAKRGRKADSGRVHLGRFCQPAAPGAQDGADRPDPGDAARWDGPDGPPDRPAGCRDSSSS